MINGLRTWKSRVRAHREAILWSATALFTVRSAFAASPTYVGPDGGDFNTAANWSTHTVPNSGDTVSIGANEGSDATSYAVFDYQASNYTNGGFASLTIDSNGSGKIMYVDQEPSTGVGSLQTTAMTIGQNYSGDFMQEGAATSTNTITGGLVIAATKNSGGEYDLDTNGSLTARTIDVGYAGLGIFSQVTGTVTVNTLLELAATATGTGTYQLQGGTLDTPTLFLGTYNISGTSSFQHSGGTANIGVMYLHNNSSYLLGGYGSSATLTTTGSEVVGDGGNATFTQYLDSTNNVGDLVIAPQPGVGTYTLNGGLLSAGSEDVDYDNTYTGTIAQNGGTNSVTETLSLGDGGSDAEYNMNGGTLTVGGAIWLGSNQYTGYGNGHFTQTAGAVSCAVLNFGNVGGMGQYVMSGGTLSAGSINLSPSNDSIGIFTQTGGTVTVGSIAASGSIVMSSTPTFACSYSLSNSAAPSALTVYGNLVLAGVGSSSATTMSFSQNGGTATINGNVFLGNTLSSQGNAILFSGSASCTVTGGMYLGGSMSAALGQGMLSVQGGMLAVDGPLQIWNTPSTSATLSSGTLQVGTLSTNGNPSLLNWTGGTLHVTNETVDFNGTSDVAAPLGSTLTLNSGQNLICDDYEWLSGNGSALTQNSGSTNATAGLFLGYTSAAASYTLNGGSLSVTANYSGEFIGDQGVGASGVFTQLGGTNSTSVLYIGFSQAQGTYSQFAGSDTITGNVMIGEINNAVGLYNIYGGIVYANSNVYIGGSATSAGGSGTLNVAGGTIQIGGTLKQYGGAAAKSITISSGSLTAGATINNGSINQTGGTASFGPLSGTGAIQVGNFSGGPAHATVASLSQAYGIIVGNGLLTISPGSDAANTLGSLTILSTGQLDLNNNHLFINYGSAADPITQIAGYIRSGYSGGTWNGVGGIMSSTAQANSGSYGIGYADSADPGNPAGLSSGQIEIMYTLLGDANLDGKVNGTDFNLMAANFNQSVTNGWDEGDFNYDGKVNGNDFVLLADNFNQFASQSSVAAADVAALDSFAAANGLIADVPEPATAVVFILPAASLLHRRRKLQ